MFIITSLGPATVQNRSPLPNFPNNNSTTAPAKRIINSKEKSLSLAVTKKLEIVLWAYIKLTKTVTTSRYQLRSSSRTLHLKKDQIIRQRNSLLVDLKSTTKENNNSRPLPLPTNTTTKSILLLKAVNPSASLQTQCNRWYKVNHRKRLRWPWIFVSWRARDLSHRKT